MDKYDREFFRLQRAQGEYHQRLLAEKLGLNRIDDVIDITSRWVSDPKEIEFKRVG